MTVRAALHVDIPRIIELLEAMHRRSRYVGACKIDVAYAKGLVMAAIGARHKPGEGGMCLFVSERPARPPETKPVVDGFIMGTLARVYLIGDRLVAQDLFFVADDAEPRAAGELIDEYLAWASEKPKVIEVNLSASDVVQPTERVERLFRRKGFKLCGVVYRKDVK